MYERVLVKNTCFGKQIKKKCNVIPSFFNPFSKIYYYI